MPLRSASSFVSSSLIQPGKRAGGAALALANEEGIVAVGGVAVLPGEAQAEAVAPLALDGIAAAAIVPGATGASFVPGPETQRTTRD